LKNCDAFAEFHPVNSILFYALVTGCTMFMLHPFILCSSLLAATVYYISLKKEKGFMFSMLYMLPLILFSALLNPAFNHEGATVVMHLPSGNPLTLEAIIYGILNAIRMAAVITWFASFRLVMTSDKFIYLTGSIIPAVSLILSMALRFVPRFTAKLAEVSEARSYLGKGVSEGSIRMRLNNALSVFSALISWAMESSIDIADSMKSRGYGMEGRTFFSIFTFESKDRSLFAILVIAAISLITSGSLGVFNYRVYPTIQAAAVTAYSVYMNFLFLTLSLLPILIDLREQRLITKALKKTYDLN